MKKDQLNQFLIGAVSCLLICMICLRVSLICDASVRQDTGAFMKTVYNEDNGLPTGEANVVTQTKDGYIWIGSYGGLIRYDGVNFKNFSEQDNVLESSSIRALYEDGEGRLYIGTNDMGVYIYENHTFSKIEYEKGDAFYSVRSFTGTSDGTVYVGTTSGLAKIIEKEGKYALEEIPDTVGYIIYDLACDKNDALWACSDNGQVLIVRKDKVETVTNSGAWMESDCYSVTSGADGSVYFGSSADQVARIVVKDDSYRAGSFDVSCVRTGKLHTVNTLYEDKEGRVWVLADNGIGYFPGNDGKAQEGMGEMVIPSVMKNMSSVCAMIQDYEGNFWTASTKTGISYFSQGKYLNVSQGSGLEETAVNAIERYRGRSYIGTDFGLIILDENGKRIENALTKQLDSRRVRHITRTDSGIFWFSLYGDGLVSYRPEKEEIKLYTTEDGLLSNQVRLTLELSDGSVAAAGVSGIDIIKDGKITKSYGEKQLPYPFILCMYEKEDGTLVAGSDGMGIYTIKDGQVRQYYKDEGLESGIVMRMVPDSEAGGVWVSAGNGLYLWKEGSMQRLPFYAGAGSILDIQIIGDELWLMKSNGPVVVKKEEVTNGSYTVRELSKDYGLTGTLVANSWNYLSEDGELWLCTNHGISMIQTKNLPVNAAAPKGAVTQVSVDGKVFTAPERINIPASAKRVTINLAVMSYTLPENSVEYYLEGFDDGKVYGNMAESSSVSYTNLAGGDYVFHMKPCNEDGVEGESVTVTIHKAYHFWELGWVKGLLILGLVAVIAVIFQIVYRMRIRGFKKRQAEYRSIIEQSLHTFANAIDAKDKDTNGHSGRVAAYSREIARRMRMSEEEQETIYYMALLHDIGKIGIPDSILKKNGKLTKEEWEVVKQHPAIGGEILKEFTAIPGIADGAKYHHEFYNGKGYCEGLKGEEIPMSARIIAVADAFDAMCSRRYYHEGSTMEYAYEEIKRCSREQFDPEAAKYMLTMIKDGFVDKVRRR